MEYLTGALVMAALFVCMYGAYRLGKKEQKPSTHREVDEQEARRAKQLRKDFNELMSYDVSRATEGKKVT